MLNDSIIVRITTIVLFILGVSLSIHAEENGEVTSTYKNNSGRKVEKLFWKGTRDGYVLVSYPDNYDPSKTYHLNFWFPGTSGKPSQGIEDENDQYVGIGLSYLNADQIKNDDYNASHWELCKSVEQSVVNRTKLKVGRRIVSGVSKGGWLAFELTLNPPSGLHGVGIIAAGKYTSPYTKLVSKAQKLAVFVGTGETDTNFPYAQLAIPFYKDKGSESLCYEEWLGEGHVSKISPRVNEWLDVQARKNGSPKSLTNFCDQIATEKLAQITAITENKDKYVALRHLLSSPSFQYVSKSVKEEVMSQGRELAKSKSFEGWLKDFNKLRDLVKAETDIYDKKNIKSSLLKKLADKYQSIATHTDHSDVKTRAAYAYLRVAKLHAIFIAREKLENDPEYISLHKKFETLRKELASPKKRRPSGEAIAEFKVVGEKFMKMRSDLGMKAFYDVEWHKNYKIDTSMDSIIEEAKSHPQANSDSFYSGLGY